MYLHAIATAVPPDAFTQQQCWDIYSRSEKRAHLKDRSNTLIKKIVLGPNGIDKRHFAINDVNAVFDLSAEHLNHAFEAEAPKLASQALENALKSAKLNPKDLDGLFICTCTGYICPGISSHVSEQLGIPSDRFLQDIVGLGCGAAIPTLRSVSHMLAALHDKPGTRVAMVAVEICSAAFYLDDDVGVIISACIFGDGAAATIWGNEPGPIGLRASGFDTLHVPENRGYLRFENKDGKLRNRLHRSVPIHARDAVHQLWSRRNMPSHQDIMISHGGGKDVLQELESHFPDQDFSPSLKTLRDYGNMSSPSVLFALEDYLSQRDGDPLPPLWLVSFGAGFSAHSCFLRHGA